MVKVLFSLGRLAPYIFYILYSKTYNTLYSCFQLQLSVCLSTAIANCYIICFVSKHKASCPTKMIKICPLKM